LRCGGGKRVEDLPEIVGGQSFGGKLKGGRTGITAPGTCRRLRSGEATGGTVGRRCPDWAG
jgi:hypothetical protein